MSELRRLRLISLTTALVLVACRHPPAADDFISVLGADYRPFEARLVGFGYAPCRVEAGAERLLSLPECSPLPTLGSRKRRRLNRLLARAGRLKDGSEKRRDAPALHTAALAALIVGDRSDRATELLRQAVARRPDDPRLWNDLAVAYLVTAQSRQRPRLLFQAFGAADQAVAKAPDLPEARFNRALILEQLCLEADAGSEWAAFMKLDRHLGWTAEVAPRASAHDRPSRRALWLEARTAIDRAAGDGDLTAAEDIAAGFPQQARLYAEDVLLPSWARATSAGAPRLARRKLLAAEAIARGLRRRTGDELLLKAVIEIRRALAGPSDRRRQQLVAGHRLYGEGRGLYEQQRYAPARERLSAARRALESAGSPFYLWAEFYTAVCQHNLLEYSAALDTFSTLAVELDQRPFPSLRGHTQWMAAMGHRITAQYSRAIDLFHQALGSFESAREHENVAMMHSMLAKTFDNLGEVESAWQHRYAALSKLDQVFKDRRFNNILRLAVEVAISEQQPALAGRFQQELIRRSLTSQNPPLAAVTFHRSALVYQRIGLVEEADKALTKAWDWSARILNRELREVIEADISMVEADLQRPTDPEKSLVSLDRVLSFSLRHNNHLRLLAAYRGRAASLIAAGEEDLAEATFSTALSEAESQIANLAARHRPAYFAEIRDLYEAMIEFYADKMAPSRLFELSEQAKVQALMGTAGLLQLPAGGDAATDPLTGTLSQALTLPAIQRRLPRHAVLISYEVLQAQLLIWVVTADTCHMARQPSGSLRLTELVEDLVRGLRQGRAESDSGAAKLHRLLIQPVAEHLPPDSTVILIPDGPLHALPFDALYDESAGGRLLEQQATVIAPSASLFIGSIRRAAELGGGRPRSLMAIGDPAFDRGAFPGLQRLPEAGEAARSLAKLYPESTILTGADASKARVFASIDDQDVVHLATHSFSNPDRSELSSLLVSPDGEQPSSGQIFLEELAGLELARTRLVVLASCRSATGSLAGVEGVASLALPLLAAGVPAVVGSLWDVEDKASADLLRRFHRQISAGADPVTALRAAKLECLRGTDSVMRSPASWAAFQVIGGGFSQQLQ